MNVICRSYIEVVGQHGTALDRMLAVVRCHLINLVNAINRLQFLKAWLESIELARSLDLAALSLDKLPAGERAAAGERLARLRSVAQRVQAMAPHPSATAIFQAGSGCRQASRRVWDSEEQAWTGERSARGPILITIGPDGLTLFCEGNP